MNQTYTVKAGDTLYGISNQFGVSVSELTNLNNVDANNLQIGQILIIPNTSGTNPNGIFLYTVKSGDTLYAIAQKYNTTVSELTKLNKLSNTSLSIGQVLSIPETYKQEEMNFPSFTTYTVKSGDSLYSIAKNNNTTVDIIISDNSLTTTSLSIGQILKIRVETEEIEECIGPDYTPPESTTQQTITYTVKSGDNLYNIAKNYNTSVSAIMNINNLTTSNLSIGQQLKIPSSTSTITYIVKSGDSLYSIARKYNTTVDQIKSKNNLTSNILSIGQQLTI